MSRLDDCFQKLKSQGRPALIPFLPAGDPHLAFTGQLIDTAIAHGADILEIGFPFSDPLADGAVIQASYARALQNGLHLDAIFTAIADWVHKHPTIPMVGMVSYSLVFRQGPDKFFERSKKAGLSGLVIPDLPLEEAANVVGSVRSASLDLIQLVTPMTPIGRATHIAQLGSGFLYVVSVTGITGARVSLSEQLIERLQALRPCTALPLCVGFGISRPEQIQTLRPFVDGVIVGSALVKYLEQIPAIGEAQVLQQVGQKVSELARALACP